MQLDNLGIVRRADPENALSVIADSAHQLEFKVDIKGNISHSHRINNIVLSGMGGSSLAGLIAKDWLDYQYKLPIPFEINRTYQLPNFVGQNSLVICFSVSGNTEETLSSFHDAINRQAQIVAVSTGGKLLDLAKDNSIPYIQLDKITQPRYGIFMHLRAIAKILATYKIIAISAYDELADIHNTVASYVQRFLPTVPLDRNQAKQLALYCAGKTPLVYSSHLFSSIAYKWKTSFNENAKNIIWCNEFPEFNHNEFIGWTSHPIEKPFAIICLRSDLDGDRINLRFDLSDRLLSGKRPAAHNIELSGKTLLEQMVNGAILGDFSSIYLGILNGVDPTPVPLVERFKKELNDQS